MSIWAEPRRYLLPGAKLVHTGVFQSFEILGRKNCSIRQVSGLNRRRRRSKKLVAANRVEPYWCQSKFLDYVLEKQIGPILTISSNYHVALDITSIL
ncbi:uncharacterized protein ColSpa_02243 [Colletotrichum spaethianum]|uniref:Uncharacterized protein n=1 Tax=Colletotrichum spaethianum TaxID=700344 RepID=A0AA37L9B9_9PEZI|nr:uncharacterized protein ColSpa_02243 [Colletotrichum spaethianum]GKT42063.1 hypothetical protein ColSpa_02243 [Colletotrichum spaethianum]